MSDLTWLYNQHGVDPNGKKRASELSAAITRAQYEDYRSRFLPYLKQMIGKVDSAGTAQAMSNAQSYLQQNEQAANSMAFGLNARNLQRYGVNATNPANNNRLASLDMAANNANTATQTYQGIVDRNQAVLSGGNLNPMRG